MDKASPDQEQLRPKSGSQVAVVGGGLVGSLQALFLAKRGFKVDLYEKREDIRTVEHAEGRSINLALSTRDREALKEVGLESVVLEQAIPMCSRMIHSPSGALSEQYYGTKGQCIYTVDRLRLNKLLLSHTENDPNITLNFRYQLVRGDLMRKKLTFMQGKKEVEVEKEFIFGCDGAFSTVRSQMMRLGQFDYSQEYIEHGYKELSMPALDGEFAMSENSLHIWPRGKFMMIALPNPDHTFTLTLFMPFTMFESINSDEELLSFFRKYFQDSVEKIGANKLVYDYFNNPTGSLMSLKCRPHFMANSTVILGDAAHAVVPFYGQGMNAGFEDCLIFHEYLTKYDDDLVLAANNYSKDHWRDSHAIADLSMYNYIEMRSHVNTLAFKLRKKVDNFLHFLFPNSFVPLYTMVAFTRIPYSRVVARDHWQKKLVNTGLFTLKAGAAVATLLALYRWSAWCIHVDGPLR